MFVEEGKELKLFLLIYFVIFFGDAIFLDAWHAIADANSYFKIMLINIEDNQSTEF